MKIDRHSSQMANQRVKPVPGRGQHGSPSRYLDASQCPSRSVYLALALFCGLTASCSADEGESPQHGSPPSSPSTTTNVSQAGRIPSSPPAKKNLVADQHNSAASVAETENSDPNAVMLIERVLVQIVAGAAFDAKVRETVWTTGREVVGVGTYEQSGGSTGRYNLQLTMHDGDGKHRLQQISDGRLAWTRTDISGRVSLRRVDVGRLDEWVRGSTRNMAVAPRLKVGAWAEMLSTIQRDFVLSVVGASLKGEPVWVVTGVLRPSRRAAILAESGRKDWPMLLPTRVRVAIRSKPETSTGFGALLPVRIEYWSDPVADGTDQTQPSPNGNGRLITLIELYSIRPISPPSAERFRFENQDAEVNFTNETDRYIEMYGVHLTERERRQLRR